MAFHAVPLATPVDTTTAPVVAPAIEGDLGVAATPTATAILPSPEPAVITPSTTTTTFSAAPGDATAAAVESSQPIDALPPETAAAPPEKWFENPVQFIPIAIATVCVLLLTAIIIGLFVRHRRKRRDRYRHFQPSQSNPTAPQGRMQLAGGAQMSSGPPAQLLHAPELARNAFAPELNLSTVAIAEEPEVYSGGQNHHQYEATSQQRWPPVAPQAMQSTEIVAAAETSRVYSASSGGVGAESSQREAPTSRGVADTSANERTEQWVSGGNSAQSLGAVGRDGGAYTHELQTLSEKLSSHSSKSRLKALGKLLSKTSSTEMQRCAIESSSLRHRDHLFSVSTQD